MLTIVDLAVDYDGIHALAGINLAVHRGEIVTLIGSNGAGKTTTLKAISGLVKPRSGSIHFQGQDLAQVPPPQRLRLGIAHCPEGRHILQKQTVKENLVLGAFIRTQSLWWSKTDRVAIQQDLERMWELFPRLAERQSQLAGTMSGGEQQMLAIARALMSRPQLLLLDEPSLGLAPQVVQDIFRVIQELNRSGMTILLVEQNAKLALEIAHRGYVLEAGKIKCSGADLLHDPRVKVAYLG